MKIAIASDHGAFALKEHLREYLAKQGHEVEDFGCYDTASCDYADFCVPAAKAVASGECERGIVLCTTGIGVSIACNKVRGIRCAHVADTEEAALTRQHNDANIIAIGAGFTGPVMAERIVNVFLKEEFEGGRHARRIGKVMALEDEWA